MPEIVDLEVAKRNILSAVKGLTLSDILVENEKVIKNAKFPDVRTAVLNKKLLDIRRYGKILIFDFGPEKSSKLPDFSDSSSLVVHLMLHGDYCWDSGEFDKFVCKLTFANGKTLLIKDWSGWMKIELEDEEKNKHSKMLKQKLGIDPLSSDFTLENFQKALLHKERSSIKPALMDQKVISGIGNAYADEALWEARIHPQTTVKKLIESNKIMVLWQAIVEVINDSIEVISEKTGGVEVSEQERDFMNVYRMNGKKCPRCGTKIIKYKFSGRDTFICEQCQKE
ncbi:Fpg/Nei family DNA glycosylase [Candidatus Dojkabacteria bacterium]|nr:Fpg/Nei family DNA glycosylase [Candidatus Dojkabacteria bacterium]